MVGKEGEEGRKGGRKEGTKKDRHVSFVLATVHSTQYTVHSTQYVHSTQQHSSTVLTYLPGVGRVTCELFPTRTPCATAPRATAGRWAVAFTFTVTTRFAAGGGRMSATATATAAIATAIAAAIATATTAATTAAIATAIATATGAATGTAAGAAIAAAAAAVTAAAFGFDTALTAGAEFGFDAGDINSQTDPIVTVTVTVILKTVVEHHITYITYITYAR